MPVDSKHPDYGLKLAAWAKLRDCAVGMEAVKAKGEDYLPMPSGFAAQQDRGAAMYAAYSARAQFPEIFNPTISGMVGMIHRREAEIKMPAALQGIWERATKDGLPLEAFHRKITTELLEVGRFGILADALPEEAGGSLLPYLAGYTAEAIFNWSAARDLFVLSEKDRTRTDEFTWADVQRYRVLRLSNGVYTQQVYTGEDAGALVTPARRGGGGTLDAIPFVVVGARDTNLDPDDPPLLGVADAALAIFRLDADYRHQLFMSGQETLCIIGADDNPSAVGAGVVIGIPLGGDAKYVGPTCNGISAHRTAIADERANAATAGAKVADASKGGVESGEALRIRNVSRTATMVTVALSSAQGLEQALRHAATMIGANPAEVVVTPNLEFVDQLLDPKSAGELVKLWQGGAISYPTLYENLQRGGIASSERSADEEKGLIDAEDPLPAPVPPVPPGAAE